MENLSQLCLNCFRDKGEYEVCPHCGYSGASDHVQTCYLQPGVILSGRFIIGKAVGMGGFGITYKAYDAKLDMIVAIKEFYPGGMANRTMGGTQVEIFTGSQEDSYRRMLERFLEEARNMAVFSKESDIVRVYDYFEENGTAYIVMEFIEGMLLKDYLKEYGAIRQKDAVPLFLNILQIINKLHMHGIIHKDISPDNLFVQENNKIKLFDFGAANFQGKLEEDLHEVVVKAGYAPPEQYRKNVKPDPTMDVYAAGALFYEIITGERPLAATDRMIEDDLELPTKLGVEVDENLEKAILKAMALDPEQRFHSIQEFYDTVAESREVEIMKPKPEKGSSALQIILIGIFSAAAVMAGIFIFVRRSNLINYKPDSGTHLNVWMVRDSAMQDEDVENMKRDLENGFEERYPEVEVDVTFVPEKDYAVNLKQTLKSDLPDVFCADYLEKKRFDECADLTLLIKRLDSVLYLFDDQYDESYPEKKQIPIGFQLAAYYKNVSKNSLKETDKIEKKQLDTYVEDGSCQWIQTDGSMDILKQMTQEKETVNAVAGSLSCWSEVQDQTVSGEHSSELQIIPVTEDGKLLCTFRTAYAVRDWESKNQEKTAMLFLYYLLGNTAQREISMKQHDILPVNAKAYREYMDNLTQYQTSYIEDQIRVSGDDDWRISVSDQVKWSNSESVYDAYSGSNENK